MDLVDLLFGKPKQRRITPRMMGKSAYRKGKIGETKTKKFLSRRGIKPIEGTERMRTDAGEYDYIARDRAGRHVAVEAKFRKSPVTSTDVASLKNKMKSEGISKAVIVTKTGATGRAEELAKKNRIKIMEYVPPQRKEKGFLDWLLG